MTDACTLEYSPQGDALLSGPLTFSSCAALFYQLERSGAGRPSSGRVDLSGVTEADSAGLALLLEWQSQRKAAGHELEMVHAPHILTQLAHLAEATEMLKLSGRAGQ